MTEIFIPDIPAAPVVPPYPALGAPNFNQMAYAVGTGMPGVVSGLNAIAAAARECALASRAYAVLGDGSRQQAEAARDAAVIAKGASESARDASVIAKNASEVARDLAVAAKGASEAARDLSVSARGTSEAARDASVIAKNASEAARDASKAYRDQAEVFASGQLKGSSSTSVTPGAGAKSFAIQPSRSFVAGMYLVATSTSDPATSMSGYVQSYDAGTGDLVIGVDSFAGAAAKADWVIGVAAPGAPASMTTQVITANTNAVPGVFYVFAVAGITLTLPTNFSAGQLFGFGMSRGIGNANINWQTNKCKGRSPAVMQLLSQNDTAVCMYVNPTDGFMEVVG
ncbi:hypothetical protein GY15_28235 [Delftia sp. 670]|uniref:hypothetical protein n=1 Tax=Delftia lacustris TaxID=558537 RepID=UPI0004D49593|nr:hypothetical protein [Delftia lacustris]KEH11461.1 hypothetical protein GY15_28235 [Delftia sp. 670]